MDRGNGERQQPALANELALTGCMATGTITFDRRGGQPLSKVLHHLVQRGGRDLVGQVVALKRNDE